MNEVTLLELKTPADTGDNTKQRLEALLQQVQNAVVMDDEAQTRKLREQLNLHLWEALTSSAKRLGKRHLDTPTGWIKAVPEHFPHLEQQLDNMAMITGKAPPHAEFLLWLHGQLNDPENWLAALEDGVNRLVEGDDCATGVKALLKEALANNQGQPRLTLEQREAQEQAMALKIEQRKAKFAGKEQPDAADYSYVGQDESDWTKRLQKERNRKKQQRPPVEKLRHKTFHLPEQTIEGIMAAASQQGVKTNQLVNEILTKYLAERSR
ncbi:MAG: hypothetical protein GC129_03530 [Proteobacteria bacterium]|nr:hypothetical protein [Pseudomonadota bacterium]